MAIVAVYDACVLYPSPVRDLYIRFAIAELVDARWSDTILDEVFRNLRSDRPDLDPGRLEITRRRMNDAVLDAVVPRNEAALSRVVGLPDPDDAHVVATAIDSGGSVIVTFNLRDFPAAALQPLGLSAVHPDVFATELLDAEPDAVAAVVRAQAADVRNPPRTFDDVLDALSRCGLSAFASRLRPGR